MQVLSSNPLYKVQIKIINNGILVLVDWRILSTQYTFTLSYSRLNTDKWQTHNLTILPQIALYDTYNDPLTLTKVHLK